MHIAADACVRHELLKFLKKVAGTPRDHTAPESASRDTGGFWRRVRVFRIRGWLLTMQLQAWRSASGRAAR
jgi:hypothetical protein